ncbi:heparinase II/III domain-containing protein [Puniceicoccus vermicola]|uniref:Heparinase II/III family protein n=1 Tax=Puniceicoccus vermicola TaxID=388746 RepID=A0A7X1AUE9_9BACT|nr:heparinase II/III family protein [Puniceicoccus vermicola]MBC2600196.1 heparinase II/III family protein [Puniceicoccus vermicola]
MSLRKIALFQLALLTVPAAFLIAAEDEMNSETPIRTLSPKASVFEDLNLNENEMDLLRSLHSQAIHDAQKPLIERPTTLEELKASGLRMKYPEKPLHLSQISEETWEQVALSFADIDIAYGMAAKLPRMAACARFTQDAELGQYVADQLMIISTWDPLQRPGWSLRNNNRITIPADGDGAWLGTGWMIRAITDSMALLPDEYKTPELEEAVHHRLNEEIDSLMDDWNTKRQWFFRVEAASSNQWVMPSEAMIRASLFTGKDEHPEAYEVGVQNLLKTLDTLGENGEFPEGLSYSSMTLTGIVLAAGAAAEEGDLRLIEHPFLQNYPTWFAHHIQPGNALINSFDMGKPEVTDYDFQQSMALFAVYLDNPVALWTLENYTGFPKTIEGVIASILPTTDAEAPSLFAYYPMATRVNWRDSWAKDSSGFWMRGGHIEDSHDHMDRGHVNFTVDGDPILIEAGKPPYDDPRYFSHFKSVAGHNVLQVGTQSPEDFSEESLRAGGGQILAGDHREAPMEVLRLDSLGGEVTVDASNAYATVEEWIRNASWDSEELTVIDTVELEMPETMLFRWHLNERANSPIEWSEKKLLVGDVVIQWESDTPIRVQTELMPATKGHGRPIEEKICVVMTTEQPGTSWNLRTTISTKP